MIALTPALFPQEREHGRPCPAWSLCLDYLNGIVLCGEVLSGWFALIRLNSLIGRTRGLGIRFPGAPRPPKAASRCACRRSPYSSSSDCARNIRSRQILPGWVGAVPLCTGLYRLV